MSQYLSSLRRAAPGLPNAESTEENRDFGVSPAVNFNKYKYKVITLSMPNPRNSLSSLSLCAFSRLVVNVVGCGDSAGACLR